MNSPPDQHGDSHPMLPVMLLSILLVAIVYNILKSRIFSSSYELLNSSDDCNTTKARNTRFKDIAWSNVLTVFLNGAEIKITNPDPQELLAGFIRDKAGLKGTKLGCEEGGCGACTVVLTKPEGTLSVNSCLRPLCANDGLAITTVEGIGSVKDGLSSEQTAIVDNFGTQCGYCTPGWVSNKHALNVQSEADGKAVTDRELEAYLDGNICRCTGYRSILKGFQSEGFSNGCGRNPSSCSHHGTTSCTKSSTCEHAIEDLSRGAGTDHSCSSKSGVGKKSSPLGSRRAKALIANYSPQPLFFCSADGQRKWFRPIGLDQLCAVLLEHQDCAVQLVGGNTSIGVSKYLNNTAPYNTADVYSVFIDVNSVPEMVACSFDGVSSTLTVGAAVTINSLISKLNEFGPQKLDNETGLINHRSIFDVTANHLAKIANTQVRNAASWAGNLMLFKKYSTFPSDAVVALTSGNVLLNLCNTSDGSVNSISMDEFISTDISALYGWIILSLTITDTARRDQLVSYCVAETFKVAQRSRNAHAQVNCGFNFDLVPAVSSYDGPLIKSVRIVFGGVSKSIFIARRTERVMTGARVNQATLNAALSALMTDLAHAGPSHEFGDEQFRISLMQSNLYQAMLRCVEGSLVRTNLITAVQPWLKPTSRGTEVYSDVNPMDPVGKAIPKLESKTQATGEAIYPSDEAMPVQGLHAALIYASKCAVNLTGIDASAALAESGVVAVYTAVDIPGENSGGAEGLKLFAEIGTEIECVGFPVGVVVATSEAIANRASTLVRISYQDIGKVPVVTLADAIAKKSFFPMAPIPGFTNIRKGDPEGAMAKAARRLKGHIDAGGQSHFYMEAQTAFAKQVDGDNFEVICGTQDPNGYQGYIAKVLGLPSNKISVKCPRTGGGFGGKLTRGQSVACASALASFKLSRPVRIFNTRTMDMNMNSGRAGFAFDYEVGFSDDGKVVALSYDMYVDCGMNFYDAFGDLAMGMRWADNAYYFPNYKAKCTLCHTNTPPRTSMRAPGVVQTCLATEIVIERVALEVGLPVADVQAKNFIQNGQTTILDQPIEDSKLDTCWSNLMERSHYSERNMAISVFNGSSLWRKRGIYVAPVRYGIGWAGYNASVQVGIYKHDGTVVVCHSGAEIGQGINTKVAQAVAHELGLDISYVRVVSTATDRNANGGMTGGSGTSECCAEAAVRACKVLNARLFPYKKSSPDVTWNQLLMTLDSSVSLNAEGWFSPTEEQNGMPFQYFVYGACLTEVELDVLTGMVNVLSSEIVYDCGKSLNPAVDIGQIEGAYMMGLGYFLTERVSYDSNGVLQSAGTWEYKPPMIQEVPSVFNVTLLKKSPNKNGILGSKAVGEPPYVLANSVYFATKQAIMAARKDAGVSGFVSLDANLTVDVRQRASLVDPQRFVLPH